MLWPNRCDTPGIRCAGFAQVGEEGVIPGTVGVSVGSVGADVGSRRVRKVVPEHLERSQVRFSPSAA